MGSFLIGQTTAEHTVSTDGEVANAAACKAVIHGFESHSVLQISDR